MKKVAKMIFIPILFVAALPLITIIFLFELAGINNLITD